MKTMMRFLKITAFSIAIAVGIIFTFTKCRKDIVVVPVPIHDTVFGKTISGIAQYPDFDDVMQLAKGASVSLYSGSTKSGNPVATCFADSTGAYSFPYLLPGSYFVWAKYNTKNQNYEKSPIEGINFETDPGYAVTLGASNLTQNITLATVAAPGNLIVSIKATDTVGSNGTVRYAPYESHSQLSWWCEYGKYSDGNLGGHEIVGGFNSQTGGSGNAFTVTEFYFDEANPQNTKIKGYCLLSRISTLNPTRDSLYNGCVPKTLQVDTYMVGTTVYALPMTDTAWYYCTAGNVEKYGKGYLAHGSMEAFYKHQGGDFMPPRIAALGADTGSWDGTGPSYAGPWNQRISHSADMYFEWKKNKMWSGANFYWLVSFEGEFSFFRSDYYLKNTSLANEVHVLPHVQLKGANNYEI